MRYIDWLIGMHEVELPKACHERWERASHFIQRVATTDPEELSVDIFVFRSDEAPVSSTIVIDVHNGDELFKIQRRATRLFKENQYPGVHLCVQATFVLQIEFVEAIEEAVSRIEVDKNIAQCEQLLLHVNEPHIDPSHALVFWLR